MLFNHHKLRRQVRRHLAEGIPLPIRGAAVGNRPKKDGAWHFSKPNPYSPDPRKQQSKRTIFAVFLIVLMSLGVFIFHPFFRLTHIRVVGVQQMSTDEFSHAVEGILSYRMFGFIPASNYYFVNTADVEDLLKKRFPLSSVHIEKQFPSTLIATVEERISTVIYDDTKTYFLVGLDGHQVQAVRKVGDDEWMNGLHTPDVATLHKEVGDFPLIVDERLDRATTTDAVMVAPPILTNIIDFARIFPSISQQHIRYFRFSPTKNTVQAITTEGWQIYLDTSFKSDAALRVLQIALTQRGNRAGLKYVDLRYPDRIYWQ